MAARLARVLAWCFWGWQGLSALLFLSLGIALLFEEAFGWHEAAHPFAAIGIMAVLVIMPGWLPVTAILGGALLLARALARRRDGSRGGA